MADSMNAGAVGGGEVAAAVDPLRLRHVIGDLFDPVVLADETPRLVMELGKIAVGRSDVEFSEKDARFADPTWRENPLYRRIGQSYLAWERSVNAVVDRQDGEWQRQARARYVADIITGALAPTNVLPGNPAAIKHAFETGGSSLLRGMRNFARDVIGNRGMPSMVDSSGFTVGENLAVSPGAVVYREEMFELLQYMPSTEKVRGRPMLVVPPELNRYYVLDLAPEKSMVEYAVSHGVQTFMLVWRNPRKDKKSGHGKWTLDDYLAAHIRAFDVVRAITGADDLNLLALCAGGITSALVQGHLAARDANPVHSTTYLVTMLDARLPNMTTMLATPEVGQMIDKAAANGDVFDSSMIRHNFAWMRPKDLVFGYVVNNWLLGNKPPAFDVLAWNDDATNLGSSFERDATRILRDGALVAPGAVTVLDTPIDLSQVTGDNFLVAGLRDHITTWRPCYESSKLLGGHSEMVIVDSGHIQSFVNPVKTSRYRYWNAPAADVDADTWLANTECRRGSWWPRWGEWLVERSGEEQSPPGELGSAEYPVIEPAPGKYVFEKS